MTLRMLQAMGVFLFAAGATAGLLGRQVSDAATLLAALAVLLGLAAWIGRDARQRGDRLPADWRWFLFIGWPVTIPWYMRRSGRSWGAAIALALLPGAAVIGEVVGTVGRSLAAPPARVTWERARAPGAATAVPSGQGDSTATAR